jgi:NitT/TauT family transport system ATP-binding protein
MAALMTRTEYLGVPAELIGRALSGRLTVGDNDRETVPDFFVPHAHHATFPSVTHGLWFYAQMVRWSDMQHTEEHARLARGCFRPDLYRTALSTLAPDLPASDARPLARSDFFDGQGFDPADLKGYIASQRPYA